VQVKKNPNAEARIKQDKLQAWYPSGICAFFQSPGTGSCYSGRQEHEGKKDDDPVVVAVKNGRRDKQAGRRSVCGLGGPLGELVCARALLLETSGAFFQGLWPATRTWM
jgi:hypothetical protein